jgi:hypothetical protein
LKFFFYITFAIVCLASSLSAQEKPDIASKKREQPKKKYSKAQFRKDSVAIMKPKLFRPQLRIDNKISFYRGDSYNIDGIDAGVIVKEKIRFTLGYYRLNDELSGYSKTESGTYFDRKLKLQYGSMNIELVYHNSRFFTLGIPFEFCFGKNTLNFKTSPTDMQRYTRSGFVSLIDLGASGTFKPIRWVGVRFTGGYRRTVINQVPGSRFDGPFISFGVAVNLREVNKDVRMFMLKKKYKRLGDPMETAVDLITD